MGKTIFYQDPLYPYFLGLIFTLFGENYFLVRILHVVMGMISLVLTYWMGRKLLGPWMGVIAASVLALYHGLYFFELQIEKSSMVLLISSASCALGVASVDKPSSWWRWGALGLSLGLLTLLRGNLQPILPMLLIWSLFAVGSDSIRQKIMRFALMIAGILLVLAPVTIRNYSVGGEWVLTTFQGGANFYIGNNELATGRYVTQPFVRPDPMWEARDFQVEAEKQTGLRLKPTEVSKFWFSESFKWIRANPVKAFQLTMHKARLLIHQYEIPDNHSFYLTRQEFVPVLWLAMLGFGVMCGPALIGILWLPRYDRRALYPALFAVMYGLSITPFYIVDRYRLALCPAIAIFFTAGIFMLVQKWKTRRWGAVIIAGVWLLVFLPLSFSPTPESKPPMIIEYYLLGNAYLITGKLELAIASYDRVLEAQPDNKEALNNRMIAIRALKEGGMKTYDNVKIFGESGPQ